MFYLFLFIIFSLNSSVELPPVITSVDQIPNITTPIIIKNRQDQRIHWFILDGKRFKFSNKYTLRKMGYENRNLSFSTWSVVKQLANGGTKVPSLIDDHPNLGIIKYGFSTFIASTYQILQRMLNPDVIYYRNDIFITYRTTLNEFRVIWLNNISGFKYTGGIEKDLNSLDFVQRMYKQNKFLTKFEFSGEDPRFYITPDDRLMVLYCKRTETIPELMMAQIEIYLSNNNTMTHSNEIILDFTKERNNEDQKNWIPFNTKNNETLFISRATPHRIVKFNSIINNLNRINISTVALTEIISHKDHKLWPWGEIRGGTRAIKLFNGDYLTFFHSSKFIPYPGDCLLTYAMGAYIFNENYPYNIKSITTSPIVHKSFYTGKWTYAASSSVDIDYVVFPMGLIESKDHKYVYVIFGKNDVDGWVMKVNIAHLKANMTQVTSIDSNKLNF